MNVVAPLALGLPRPLATVAGQVPRGADGRPGTQLQHLGPCLVNQAGDPARRCSLLVVTGGTRKAPVSSRTRDGWVGSGSEAQGAVLTSRSTFGLWKRWPAPPVAWVSNSLRSKLGSLGKGSFDGNYARIKGIHQDCARRRVSLSRCLKDFSLTGPQTTTNTLSPYPLHVLSPAQEDKCSCLQKNSKLRVINQASL